MKSLDYPSFVPGICGGIGFTRPAAQQLAHYGGWVYCVYKCCRFQLSGTQRSLLYVLCWMLERLLYEAAVGLEERT